MEEVVHCDAGSYQLTGTLTRPAVDGGVPIVIMLHGFTAGRDEFGGIFSDLALLLGQNGVASVRFDFGGTGDSGGRFDEMSLMTELSDARAILAYTKSLDFVDTDNISLVGASMGGAVASLLAEEYPEDVSGLVLWAPAARIPDDARSGWFERMAGSDGTIKLWDGFEVGKRFVDDVKDLDFFSGLGKYDGGILIIYGGYDPVMWGGYAEKYAGVYPEGALEIIKLKGVPHRYWGLVKQKILNTTSNFLYNFIGIT